MSTKTKKPPAAGQAETLEPTRTKLERTGPCPKTPAHTNTRVYRTVGQTRYCVCDDCGHTFKRIAPAAEIPEEA
jgi:hypothetical protein